MLSTSEDTIDHDIGNTASPLASHSAAQQGHNSSDSLHTQAQMILKALQDFVIPLVQSVSDGQLNKNSRHDTEIGPGANQLLAGLQKFILCIVRSQHMGQDSIEVDLTDDRTSTSPEPNEVKEEPNVVSEPPTISPERMAIVPGDSFTKDDHDEPSEPTTLQTVLAALREHISNKMPIRLLCFTPDINGTKLLVSLLDRSGIYAHLASKIQSNFNEDQFLLEMKPYSIYHSNKTSAEREFIQEWVAKHARYAILSHTWLRTAPGEVTYSDWNKGVFNTKHAGYQKLINFCKTASRDHGLTLGWMDTICINKESSTELDESIRSMYNWYRDSGLCITYLRETATLSDVHKDPWFTRGWTLQELLAPGCIKFYDMDWVQLIGTSDNDKWDPNILESIDRATTLTVSELHYIHGASISRRMQLAARREVTREEDTAYSLMGIFEVSISIAYGEGAERAFFRLLKEILSASKEEGLDIFNWAGNLPDTRTRITSLLPLSPSYYLHSSNKQFSFQRPMEPLTLTHLGLQIPLLLMPAISTDVARPHSIAEYYTTIDIAPIGYYEAIERIPHRYDVLDRNIRGPSGWTAKGRFQMMIAVLNCGGDGTGLVLIPKTCLAVCLFCEENVKEVSRFGKVIKIHTTSPVVFKLELSGSHSNSDEHYRIHKDRLGFHGMQMLSMCL